jgi:hypothetical protein
MKLLDKYTGRYANIDVNQKLDARLVHFKNPRARVIAKTMKIDFRPALTGFKEYRHRKFSPIIEGIVCTKKSAKRIQKRIEELDQKKAEQESGWIEKFDSYDSAKKLSHLVNALYVINKEAKRQRDVKRSIWDSACPTKHHFVQKAKNRGRELYELKDKVIRLISRSAEKIEIHEVNGDQMYCYYFGETCFHSFVESELAIQTDKTITTEISAEKKNSGMSLRRAEILIRHFISNVCEIDITTETINGTVLTMPDMDETLHQRKLIAEQLCENNTISGEEVEGIIKENLPDWWIEDETDQADCA